MKNNHFLSMMAAFGLATAASALAQTEKPVTFVDVATLGDGATVVRSGGTTKVDATVLTKNQRWTRDRVYVLANNVFITNGVTLTIEPGTLIRAEQVWRAAEANGQPEAALTPADPGALIVARGGRIIASGTADAPIIFTSIDDPNVPGGVDTIPTFENKDKTGGLNPQRILKTDVTTVSGTNGVGLYTLRGGALNTSVAKSYNTSWASGTNGINSAFRHEGLWGGIVICGRATLNRGYADGVNANSNTVLIEEPVLNPSTGAIASGNQRGVQLVEGMAGFSDFSFGGGDQVNPPDDSGVLRFISNRYGGYVIALNAELNSYSFYGVGRGTVLEFLEAWNNQDDDFEFWGGDVGMRYALSMFCGDDGFDTDQGFLGAVQYFVQVQNNANGAADSTTLSGRSTSNYGDSLTENDGPEGANSAVPFSTYILSNGTLIGRGYASAASWSSANPFAGPNFRDNGGAQWYNSIIMDNPNGAVLITDRTSTGDVTTAQMNSSLGRYAFARTNGGFDAAGRNAALADDATAPTGPDGKFVGCWFYRNGLAKNGAFGVDGKYTNKTSFDADYTNGSITNFHVATSAQLFPSKHDRNGRGASADLNTNRANTPNVIAQLTNSSNRNVFDADPGLTVNPYTRTSGLNLVTTNTNVLSVSNSVPNVRNMNPDANFAGAVRNSMWMKGWTLSDKLGVFAGTLEVPVVSLTINGSGQPVISFGSVSGYKYVVEVSTDNRTYSRVATVQASGASSTVTDADRFVSATPIYYRVITL